MKTDFRRPRAKKRTYNSLHRGIMGECDQKNHRWAEQQPRIYPLMSGRISHFYEALSKCEPAQQAGQA